MIGDIRETMTMIGPLNPIGASLCHFMVFEFHLTLLIRLKSTASQKNCRNFRSSKFSLEPYRCTSWSAAPTIRFYALRISSSLSVGDREMCRNAERFQSTAVDVIRIQCTRSVFSYCTQQQQQQQQNNQLTNHEWNRTFSTRIFN